MAAPSYVATGALLSTINDGVFSWPAGHEAGDIGLLIVETPDNATAALGVAAGFQQLPESPVIGGSGSTGTRLTAFWCRADQTTMDGNGGSMPSVTVTDPGNHVIGAIHTFRGCVPTGDPWDIVVADDKGTASTSASAPGGTTTANDCLIVSVVSHELDSASAQFSDWANADLTDLQERFDAGGTSGNGGGYALVTGVKATAGAFGDTTATVTNSVNASLTIALRPLAGSDTLLSIDPVSMVFEPFNVGLLHEENYVLTVTPVGMALEPQDVPFQLAQPYDPAEMVFEPGEVEFLSDLFLAVDPVDMVFEGQEVGLDAIWRLEVTPVAMVFARQNVVLAATGVTVRGDCIVIPRRRRR